MAGKEPTAPYNSWGGENLTCALSEPSRFGSQGTAVVRPDRKGAVRVKLDSAIYQQYGLELRLCPSMPHLHSWVLRVCQVPAGKALCLSPSYILSQCLSGTFMVPGAILRSCL